MNQMGQMHPLNHMNQIMYPIFFNPFNNQISYSTQNPTQGKPTFVPIIPNSMHTHYLSNPVSQAVLGNLTLNAEKLNQDLHNQNMRNTKIKENHHLWSHEHRPPNQHRQNFSLLKNGGSMDPKEAKNLSPHMDESSFQSTNQDTNQGVNLKMGESSKHSESNSLNMNIQINVEFDNQNMDMSKVNFKKLIMENMKDIRGMKEVKNIHVYFSESTSSTPKINSETKMDQAACNSISLISTSETFDMDARITIEESLWNVLKNSLLYESSRSNHKSIIQQTIQIVFQILNSINFSNSISFEKNFFRLFNLQVPIDVKLFSNLTQGSKIKILCYLFCKYFKKNIISLLYEDFYDQVNISEICSDNRSKPKRKSDEFFLDVSESKNPPGSQPPRPPAEADVKGAVKLSSIFPNFEDNSFDWLLIRKLMILLVHQLRLFKDYIGLKLGATQDFKSGAETVRKLKACIYNQTLCDEQFEIDEASLRLSLSELVARVSIRDLQLYVAISNVDFLPKRTTKMVFFVDQKNEKCQFEMTLFERDSLLLPKIKRKDEKIKFVFKSIRKQLFNEFKLQSKNNNSVSKTKKLFNAKYLNGNEEAIKYFYSNDLSKKKLKILNNCNRLIYNMKNYKNEKYIKDQVEISIYRKSEDFLNRKQMEFCEFKKILFDRQSKHTWILQDILNSIPAFEAFFVFSRLKKRIKKNKFKRSSLV